MYKPVQAGQFYKLKGTEKMKTLLSLKKKFGPHPHLRGKRFIIVTAMTLPFPVSHLSGDLAGMMKAFKIYIGKMKGKLIGKAIFTDTIFRLLKNKEVRMMTKAYRVGGRI